MLVLRLTLCEVGKKTNFNYIFINFILIYFNTYYLLQFYNYLPESKISTY